MAILNVHHIVYDPEWKVELTAQMHKLITTLQKTNASSEQYARWINFVHALMAELNRMRMELDTGITQPKPWSKKKYESQSKKSPRIRKRS